MKSRYRKDDVALAIDAEMAAGFVHGDGCFGDVVGDADLNEDFKQ